MSKNKQFGKELRRLRRDKEFTLADLADEISYSIVHLSDIERGRRNPPDANRIKKLLRKLGAEERFDEFLMLALKARQSIEIPVEDKSDDMTTMLAALARRCDEGSIDPDMVRRISEILGFEKGQK